MNEGGDVRTELAKLSQDLERARRELAAREDELQCLYRVASTAMDAEKGLEDKLNGILEIVSTGSQGMEVVGARIVLEGRSFQTPRFSETPWRQFCEVIADGTHVGVVEVFYARDLPSQGDETSEAWKPRFINAVAKVVGERLRQKRVEHRIDERVKELHCLYNVSEMTHDDSASREEVFQGIVESIPPAFQYPEITRARIVCEGQTFVSESFEEGPFRQSQRIAIDGRAIGTVEVFYLEERPPGDEGPFLKEERHLLKVLAERLGDFVRRRQAEDLEIRKSLELQAYNQELQQQLQVVREQNEVIVRQRDIIQELSTPVLEVWDDVLTLPIIGLIDTKRAAEIMQRLLSAVVEKRAQFVIVDVTGVPIVDTQVADHLIQIVQAAGLLGASCMLTGIRPAVARALVELGVDLSAMNTRRSFRAGLRECVQSVKRPAKC
ncbi:STAS domain-containing protein [Polyangium jinanense]|uniref:STAS domain-containing protein n=1 Tax=Polyangium jinanense TaxID=2829994 RepID=A0A9X3XAP2_9BACT|nr:STAS domain-containing protein [Polyangium jinanense]MDC3957106.1 STAS domain-containing protein [Polyangium jinanense]MDC3986864.1 STAS domain-containing protein [Polyangium jinanense]